MYYPESILQMIIWGLELVIVSTENVGKKSKRFHISSTRRIYKKGGAYRCRSVKN